MFTGIIEEVGEVASLKEISGGLRIAIRASMVLQDMKIGDSININGACHTLVEKTCETLTVEVVGETIDKTTMGELKPGGWVNLERALRANGRWGGHFVQGHVNGVGRIRRCYPRGKNYYLEVQIPAPLMRYVLQEGSIALDGISLTVARLHSDAVGMSIIPHTVRSTTLEIKRSGDRINIEVDILAKYIEKLLISDKGKLNVLNELKKWGY